MSTLQKLFTAISKFQTRKLYLSHSLNKDILVKINDEMYTLVYDRLNCGYREVNTDRFIDFTGAVMEPPKCFSGKCDCDIKSPKFNIDELYSLKK